MSETIINDINNKKAFLAQRARENYHKRKSEGRQKIKKIPSELQKKAGRPKKEQPEQTPEPKQRGRRATLINTVESAPEYIIKMINKNKPLEAPAE
jgi:hypothetical protein